MEKLVYLDAAGMLASAGNRLLHGRSKAERNLDAARDTKARQDLDQHRVETGDEG